MAEFIEWETLPTITLTFIIVSQIVNPTQSSAAHLPLIKLWVIAKLTFD